MKINLDFLNGFQSDGQMILAIVIIIAASILIFLLLREVFCWYYKINSRLREARKTNDLLEEIRDELSALNNAVAAISYQTAQMQQYANASGYQQNAGDYAYGQYGADPYQAGSAAGAYSQPQAQQYAQQYAQQPQPKQQYAQQQYSQPQAQQQYAQQPQAAATQTGEMASAKASQSYAARQKRYAQEQKAQYEQKKAAKAAVNPHAAPEPPYVAAHMQYPSSAEDVTVAVPLEDEREQ